ncbi:MAG: rhomboid family intramembrane serine protease [Eubacterium sp.]|nr:rhomboid family intramembrane serine protease [Eubacterium sp.]
MSEFNRRKQSFSIPNLPLYLIIAYVIGYVIQLTTPELYQFLQFNPYEIFQGQIWRVVTWILVPPESLGIFTIIMLFLYYSLGRELEHTWGSERFTKYIFSGIIFTVIAGLILYVVLTVIYGTAMGSIFGVIIGGYVSTYYINMSIFLAYAFTYPEQELLLYFIIPIKIKWFGFLYVAYIIYDIISAFRTSMNLGLIVLVLIAASLLNVVIYVILDKKSGRRPSSIKRKAQYNKSIKKAKPNVYANGARHKCVICGRTELDDPTLTFRYCSKCSGNKEYCQEHLFTHEHK